MHFNGQNWKKWRKRTPIIFWFYIEIGPSTFSEGHLGWENDIFSKNRTGLIWWHIFPESLMPPGQFAVLGTSGPLFKTVLQFWTHVSAQIFCSTWMEWSRIISLLFPLIISCGLTSLDSALIMRRDLKVPPIGYINIIGKVSFNWKLNLFA